MKILLIFVALSLFNANAVYTIDHPDSDHVDLGKNYPSVGRFSYNKLSGYSSGVLVETGIPQLNGRVVLTVAHNFDDSDYTTMLFITDQGSSSGKLFRHPDYKILDIVHSETGEIEELFEHDIALFLLDQKISGIPLSSINFDSVLSRTDCKTMTNVGYGDTGHLLNAFTVYNSFQLRRACHTILLSEDTMFNNSLTNYVKNFEPLLVIASKQPQYDPGQNAKVGFIGPGDSGGGCFINSYLVGLNAWGLDDDNGKLSKYDNTVVQENCFDSIKRFLPNDFDLNSITVIDQASLYKYFQPDLKLMAENNIDANTYTSYGYVIRLSYYKDWILKMFRELSNL